MYRLALTVVAAMLVGSMSALGIGPPLDRLAKNLWDPSHDILITDADRADQDLGNNIASRLIAGTPLERRKVFLLERSSMVDGFLMLGANDRLTYDAIITNLGHAPVSAPEVAMRSGARPAATI